MRPGSPTTARAHKKACFTDEAGSLSAVAGDRRQNGVLKRGCRHPYPRSSVLASVPGVVLAPGLGAEPVP
ncbi:MAG: hypothetical protein RSD99_22670, partial [Janthinobacterium sp.]